MAVVVGVVAGVAALVVVATSSNNYKQGQGHTIKFIGVSSADY